MKTEYRITYIMRDQLFHSQKSEMATKEDLQVAEEGCLSLEGLRKVKRYKNITVEYQDLSFKKHRQEFSGFIAQNIQHQCDHIVGVVV